MFGIDFNDVIVKKKEYPQKVMWATNMKCIVFCGVGKFEKFTG